MTKFKSKAEKAFEVKLEALLVRPILVTITDETVAHQRQPLDIESVERLFMQYGHYLELVDMNTHLTPTEGKNAARMAQDLVGVEHGTGELVYK